MGVLTLCSSRTAIPTREEALANFYAAERRAGSTPIEANERMHFFAKRLDDLQYQADLNVIRACMERVS
jgi:hypothetical protein